VGGRAEEGNESSPSTVVAGPRHVLIVGSDTSDVSFDQCAPPSRDSEHEEFRSICRSIGAEIARSYAEAVSSNEPGIPRYVSPVVCSDWRNTADYWIIEGAEEELAASGLPERHRLPVHLYRPRDDDRGRSFDEDEFPHVEFDRHYVKGQMPPGVVGARILLRYHEAMKLASEVLVIGGRENGYFAQELASGAGKLALPVPASKGAAAELWRSWRGLLEERLPERTLVALERPWDPDRTPGAIVAALVDLADQVTSAGHHDVFISYVREDGTSLARVLRTELIAQDLRVWMDDGTPPGMQLTALLRKAISDASVFVPLLTSMWEQSEWCQQEADTARDERVLTIPVFGPEVQIPDRYADLIGIQWPAEPDASAVAARILTGAKDIIDQRRPTP